MAILRVIFFLSNGPVKCFVSVGPYLLLFALNTLQSQK